MFTFVSACWGKQLQPESKIKALFVIIITLQLAVHKLFMTSMDGDACQLTNWKLFLGELLFQKVSPGKAWKFHAFVSKLEFIDFLRVFLADMKRFSTDADVDVEQIFSITVDHN